MAEKQVIEIEAKTKDAQKGVDNLAKSIDGAAKEQQEFNQVSKLGLTQLDKITGGAVTGFRKLSGGIKAAKVGMISLRGAVMATGIGALLIAITSLVSYFTKTQRGADKLNQVFKGLGAVVDVLIDRVSSFGEGLFMILSGDFEGGFNLLKQSISGVGDEMLREGKAAIQLEKDMQDLQDREIAFIKVQAEKQRAIAQARLAAEDESKSDKERAKALEEAVKVQNELTDEQISIEKERARIIRERVALGESTRDDLEEQARAEARVIELETERSTRLIRLQTRLNSFTDGVKDNTKATEKEAEAKEKLTKAQEELNKKREEELALLVAKSRENDINQQATLLEQASKLEDSYLEKTLDMQDQEVNAVLDKYFAIIEAQKQAGIDSTILETARQEEINKIDKRYADQRKDLKKKEEDAKLNIVGNALGAATALAEKGSATYKALAVAQVLMDTFRGIQGAFSSNSQNPGAVVATGGAWPFIQAAAAAAFGAANLKGILSVNPSGGGASAPSASVGSRASASVSGPQFNIQAAQQQNRLLNDISGTLGQPARAYVVASDITTAQQLDRNRINNASF